MRLNVGFCLFGAFLLAAAYSVSCQQQNNYQRSGFIDLIKSPVGNMFQHLSNFISDPIGTTKDFIRGGFEKGQRESFKLFMKLYNKTYSSPAEITKRLKLFIERQREIKRSIEDYAAGRVTFMMRENRYLDWDENELKILASASRPTSEDEFVSEEHDKQLALPSEKVTLPASKDWRLSGCIGKVISQEDCGCCYAVATIQTLESRICLHNNRSFTYPLSVQQIIDCSSPYDGCDGGWPTRTLLYLMRTNKVSSEWCYPLKFRQQACQRHHPSYCTSTPALSESRLRWKILNDENDFLYYVATSGPIVALMQATHKFLYYGEGIFDDSLCSGSEDAIDHAIAIVGYGKEREQDYWLIKNSWGADWGDNGYAKIRRGKNACSIGYYGWAMY